MTLELASVPAKPDPVSYDPRVGFAGTLADMHRTPVPEHAR
ncbi:hypothetical protein [Sporotomaculum syntrophicum]|nr:hypothetical protein [Sporotomaculum syntrophicum]